MEDTKGSRRVSLRLSDKQAGELRRKVLVKAGEKTVFKAPKDLFSTTAMTGPDGGSTR